MSKAIRVGLHLTPDDPYWVLVRETIIQNAEKTDIYLVPVDVPDFAGLPEAAQTSWLEELQAQELDALISKDLNAQLSHKVLALGIPMVYAGETAIRHARFTSPYVLYYAAQMIGQYLAGRLGGQGSLLIVSGPEGIEYNRVNGIRSALEAFPQIRQYYLPGPWGYTESYSTLLDSMQQIPEPVDAIFGLSDSLALAGRDAGQMVGIASPQTLVAGINGDLLALAAIADGSMAATVETSAANFGTQLVDLARKAAQGMPLPTCFTYDLTLVTADNIATIMKHKLVSIANLPTRLIGVNRQKEQKRLSQLETSLEINRRIGSTLDRLQLLPDIAELIRKHFGYDQVYLYFWSEPEQVLILDHPTKPAQPRDKLPLAHSGLLGLALTSNDLIFIPDALRSLRFPPDPTYPTTRSRVVLPIRLGDLTLGLLDLHGNQPTQHTRDELVGLQLLADQLGVAIRNVELYEQALQARAIAEKADQFKTSLLANVSHELRTPLNIILGYSQSALASPNPYDIDLPPMLQRDLHQIYKSGEHLLRLINDLLDFSRAEIGELVIIPETIAPRSFLEDVFRSFSDCLTSGCNGAGPVRWQLQLPDRLPLIQADPARLRQILLNLLANAHKFTSAGHILLGADVETPYLHIWIEDTGDGIPVEQQEQVFEPFVTIGRRGRRNEGIGLGLAVTRRMVALHRGTITLESQVGRGSTFHIYLPLPSLSGQSILMPSETQPVLLIISAQPDALRSLELTRLPRGWIPRYLQPCDSLDQVLSAGLPSALAWDLAHASPGDWILIQQIRSHPLLCQLPFILFGQESIEKSAPAAVTGVLTKPMRGKTLIDMIETLRPALISGPVLIVDDDPQARDFYRSVITQALPGVPIREVGDGAEALAVMEQAAPAFVVLDLIMPEMDGFTILAKMRADHQLCHVPVLVISGHILSAEDIKRLDYPQVVFHSKDILSEAETGNEIRRALLGDDKLPQPTSTLVKQTIVYLQQNYAQNLSRQQMAQAIGVSEGYLGRIFLQELGLSPMEYLNRYRIKVAKELLKNTAASITEIATQVGFDDSAYFSRAFSKQVGLSPRAFRK